MCGIIGYVGGRQCGPILYRALKKLEYRGYDSAGVATIHQKSLLVKKDAGKVDEIQAKLDIAGTQGNEGIAHTRWATHGGVSKKNAHPHASCNNEVAIVHNGIVENHDELREVLSRVGHKFTSETDSEVIAHLLEENLRRSEDFKQAVFRTTQFLAGSFAFLAIFRDKKDLIVGARKDAPLVLGVGQGENFVSSDVLAFIEHTDRVVFLDNTEVVFAEKTGYRIYGFDGKPVMKAVTQVAWEIGDISKSDYAHYTLKEIHEQSRTVLDALRQDSRDLKRFCDSILGANRLYMTGCGTSFHAGLIGKFLLSRYTRIPAEVILSSEFGNYSDMLDKDSIVITISQSGETADVLSAVTLAREVGARVFSIVNAKGSSLTRESDLTLTLNCGPEVGVAATKSFTAQVALITLIVSKLSDIDLKKLFSSPVPILSALGSEASTIHIANKYGDRTDFYFVGRGIHHPIALEGALKLKELAYVHAEGLAAGELKHGTLALIEEGTPAVVINPKDATHAETLSNAEEMKARGARIIGVSDVPNKVYDDFVKIPTVDRMLYPVVEVIPLQLLAYYAAVERQRDPDFPRNLAKSVTVK